MQHREHLSPCESCVEKPCLNACPVNAFSTGQYEVEDCRAFLDTEEGDPCVKRGCAARRACPIGKTFLYADEHAEFHMQAFMATRLKVM